MAAALASIAVFATLATVVSIHPEPLGIDRAAARAAAAIHGDTLTAAMRTFSLVGSSPGIALQIAAVGGMILVIRRDPRPGLWLLGAFAGAWLLSNGFKSLLDRPRPDAGLVDAAGAAFPSGHATQGGAFFVMLGVVLAATLPRPWRVPVVSVAVSVGVLSGLSRIYVGVHWLTDVGGGFALGLAWVAVLLAVGPTPSPAKAEGLPER